jgi:hypothetical protein
MLPERKKALFQKLTPQKAAHKNKLIVLVAVRHLANLCILE